MPGEEAYLDRIIETMATYMNTHYKPGDYQRAGNTKTHGILRGEVIIRDDLPTDFRHGVFAETRKFPAWVRFSGPGRDSPPDIDDVGFVSIGIKMMGVPGPKLLDDEKFTQDLIGICTPTFVTPDTKANRDLQAEILKASDFSQGWRSRRHAPHDHEVCSAVAQTAWRRIANRA